MTILIHSIAALAIVGIVIWYIRRVAALRATRWDMQECMNSPLFIIKADGSILTYRNAERNKAKTVVQKMFDDEKNILDWVDEPSRKVMRKAIDQAAKTRERQTITVNFLSSLAQSEVFILWYGPGSLALIIDMPSAYHSEMSYLRNEAYLLNNILENMPLATTVKDINDKKRYIISTRQVGMQHGIDGSKLVGHNMKSLPIEMQEVMEKADLEVMQRGVYDATETIRFSDGYVTSINIHKVLIKDRNEQPSWILTTTSDANELVRLQNKLSECQQQLEKAHSKVEESNRLKEEFMHNMSHELRTPLNAIVGFAGLLADSEDKKEREDLAKIISNNAEMLITEADDLRQLSQIESGGLNLHVREVNLNTLIEESIAEAHWLDKPQLRYSKVLPGKNYSAIIDHRQVRVILRNIISNAIKFTETGKIEIGYEVQPKGIHIHVTDTGCGIAPENKDRIFNRFEKLGVMQPGIGLGLTICKALVDKMGGQIGVESELGKGTTIWFELPCQVQESEALDESSTVSRLWEQLVTVRTMRRD